MPCLDEERRRAKRRCHAAWLRKDATSLVTEGIGVRTGSVSMRETAPARRALVRGGRGEEHEEIMNKRD